MRTTQEFRTGDILIDDCFPSTTFITIFIAITGYRISICKNKAAVTEMKDKFKTKIMYNTHTDIYMQYDT